MLITFKSRADGDVIMFGDVAKSILDIVGKDSSDTRGIITVEQIPAAIEALKTAVVRDKQKTVTSAEEKELGDIDPDDTKPAAAPVSLAQRIAPLLTMLGYSLKAKTPVTWEG